MAEPRLPPARYETQDVSLPWLAAGLGGTLVVLLLCALLALWLYPSARVDRRLPTALPEYPSPQLQSDPRSELQRFVQQELAQLNTSGWIDRAHGEAHIPIDQAMKRVAQQGIPDWPTPDK